MNNLDKNGPQGVNPLDTTFCSFHVGQHVVCVNDAFPGNERAAAQGVVYPRRNIVYTIRRVKLACDRNGCVKPGLQFVELVNPSILCVTASGKNFAEVAFDARRFRPLQKLKIEDFMPVVEHRTDEVRA